MNENLSHSIIQLNADELKELTIEVAETVALNINSEQIQKPFIAAELWKITKNKKRFVRRSLYCM